MENKLIISPSPHIHSGDTIGKNMYGVLIALVPVFLVSLYYFGLGALIVTMASVLSCVLVEYLIQKFLMKKELSIKDGSAILTGVLLAFNLPSNLPVWIIIVGALAAIGIGKMSFGGLGNNIFNPALVGRVFLLISFPAQMTTWPTPGKLPMVYIDGATGATPLSLLKEGVSQLPSIIDMLLGNMGGSIGEVSAIALLLGFVYLLVRKIISWHIPVAVLGTVFTLTGILYLMDPASYANPFIHLISGGLLLGAIFMATDYVTSPM
ncbi:MAG: RnfABCDGE type electron transport complex subunit D, partial [Tannerellaceae bacterium]|nr:RnfABCDGE type electron transport complex subunit D [Tannerellaceae bacterium]